LGQYDPANVQLERDGKLDDPAYIKTLAKDHSLRKNENVFSFSLNLASLQIMQMLSMIIAPLGFSNVGEHLYHFVTGRMYIEYQKKCLSGCIYQKVISSGDKCPYLVTGQHQLAKTTREAYFKKKEADRKANRFGAKISVALRSALTEAYSLLKKRIFQKTDKITRKPN
jgi:hypothetical protein